MKIDIYTHIVPGRVKTELGKVNAHLENVIDRMSTLYNLDDRFRVMDQNQDVRQVLTLSLTASRILEDQKWAMDFSKRANDEIAELVSTYPDRFAAGVASLPMTDVDGALMELDRAIKVLKLKGLHLFTPTKNKPLDSAEFLPFFQKMQEYDLPIWIHPKRPNSQADYMSMNESKYYIYQVFGWPYETTTAMTHLVFGGVLERFPDIKIITHHCGAMVPFFEQRIELSYGASFAIYAERYGKELRRPLLEYFKMFYADTALSGSTAALMCGYAFFGTEHLLFGSDMPFDAEFGAMSVRKTIASVDGMAISDADKQKIYEGNAKQLLKLEEKQ